MGVTDPRATVADNIGLSAQSLRWSFGGQANGLCFRFQQPEEAEW